MVQFPACIRNRHTGLMSLGSVLDTGHLLHGIKLYVVLGELRAKKNQVLEVASRDGKLILQSKSVSYSMCNAMVVPL